MFRMEPGRNREDPTPKVEVKEKGTRKKKGMRERDIERESGKGQASSLSPSLSLSPLLSPLSLRRGDLPQAASREHPSGAARGREGCIGCRERLRNELPASSWRLHPVGTFHLAAQSPTARWVRERM